MAIRNWHPGKLIMLWAWGGLVAGLILTDFMGRPVGSAPVSHLLEFAVTLIILVVLSALTWHWLGGKDSH